jgi:hypothetical protein
MTIEDNDPVNKAFEQYIWGLIFKYSPILRLQQFLFEVKRKNPAYMGCYLCYPYLNAKIEYSDEAEKDWNDGKDMEHIVLHELCHLLTDPLYCKAFARFVSKEEIEDERERLTDHICNIVLPLCKTNKGKN